MKYLLVLALVALVFFFWQAKRRADLGQRPPSTAPRTPARLKTTDMVECAVCRVHLPRNEALELKQLSYCSEAHRLEAELADKGSKNAGR
jgi:uncharacterized protein